MVTSVLIASPTIAFGELIRLTLEGEGNYRVTRVSTACEALAQCQATPFALAILDTDLSDLPFPDLLNAVQKLRPDIRLIIVPPHSDPASPAVAGLPSHGYLNKPFYLPELISIVTRALQPQAQPSLVQPATELPAVPTEPAATPRPIPLTAAIPPPAPTKPNPPPAAISPPTPGPAVDGSSPKRPASKPIAPTAPVWLQDVARAAQHLTRLSLETAALAALIIRDGKLWAYAGQLSQPAAQELAQTVAHYWARGNGTDLARFFHLDATDGDYMLYATAVSGDMALAMVFDVEMPFSKIRSQASHLARSLASPPGSVPPQPRETTPPQPATYPPQAGQLETEEALDLANLTPLFDDVPPASPGQPPSPLAPETSRAPSSPSPNASSSRTPYPQAGEGWMSEANQAVTQPDTVEVTQSVPEEASMDSVEPVSPAVYNLNYACMMLPRMPQHLIEGDLAERLSGWARQLCLAFGWRLDRIAINPDHVEWVINVPPTASPSTIMRIFRQQTSARIFADFPALGRDNPSGDFWAPGYLIISSGQLPPESLVKDFIQQTRRRQGVSYPKF